MPTCDAVSLDRWTVVGNAGGGHDGGVDGLAVVGGASRGQRRERGDNQRCANVQSDSFSKYCVKYCELQHCTAPRKGG